MLLLRVLRVHLPLQNREIVVSDWTKPLWQEILASSTIYHQIYHYSYDHFFAVSFNSVHNGWTTSVFLPFTSSLCTFIQLLFFVQNMTYRSEVQVTLNFCAMQVSIESLSPQSNSRFTFLRPHLMEGLAYSFTLLFINHLLLSFTIILVY